VDAYKLKLKPDNRPILAKPRNILIVVCTVLIVCLF